MGIAPSRKPRQRLIRSIEELPSLTNDQCDIIKSLWHEFLSCGKVNGGLHFFVDLFRLSPGAKVNFSFVSSMKECNFIILKTDNRVRMHVNAFFSIIANVVERLPDIDGGLASFEQKMLEQGSIHSSYGINSQYIQNGGDHLLYALRMQLGHSLPEEAREAFLLLYNHLVSYMLINMPSHDDKYTDHNMYCESVDVEW